MSTPSLCSLRTFGQDWEQIWSVEVWPQMSRWGSWRVGRGQWWAEGGGDPTAQHIWDILHMCAGCAIDILLQLIIILPWHYVSSFLTFCWSKSFCESRTNHWKYSLATVTFSNMNYARYQKTDIGSFIAKDKQFLCSNLIRVDQFEKGKQFSCLWN